MPVVSSTMIGALQATSDAIKRAREFLEGRNIETPLTTDQRETVSSITSAIGSLLEAGAIPEDRRAEAQRLLDELTRVSSLLRHPFFAIDYNGTPIGLRRGEDGRLERLPAFNIVSGALDMWTQDLNEPLLREVLGDMGLLYPYHNSEMRVPLFIEAGGKIELNRTLFPDASPATQRFARSLAVQLEMIHYTLKQLGMGMMSWEHAYVTKEANGQARIYLDAEKDRATLLDASPLSAAYGDLARFYELIRARTEHPFVTNLAVPAIRNYDLYVTLTRGEEQISHMIVDLRRRGRLPNYNRENYVADLIEGFRLHVSARGAEYRELLSIFANPACVKELTAIMNYYIDALGSDGITNFTVMELFEIVKGLEATPWSSFAKEIIDAAPDPSHFNMHAYWKNNHGRILSAIESDQREEEPLSASRWANRRRSHHDRSIRRPSVRRSRQHGGLGISGAAGRRIVTRH